MATRDAKVYSTKSKRILDNGNHIINFTVFLSQSKKFKGKLETLDASQRLIVENIAQPGLKVIEGPPGIGKAFVSALSVILSVIKDNFKILILTQTNVAAGHILRKILSIINRHRIKIKKIF